jgi:hypothetical protein
MSAAKERGKRLIQEGADPYKVYGSPREEVNTRISPDLIFRQAIACWPKNEVAFEVARQGDASERAVRHAAVEAQRRTERELKFLVILQMPQFRDPAEIQFVMRSNRGNEYPPLAVETPTKLRDILVGLDPNMPPSALYRYEVHFPLTGSPGYPPIDTTVSSVGVVVRDGGSEGEQWFSLPHRPM